MGSILYRAHFFDSKVTESTMSDVSALGAAYLAGLGIGIFKNLSAVKQLFGQRPALISGKYLEAGKNYETWNKLID